MSYKVSFYDKLKQPITISDDRGEALKQALLLAAPFVEIDDNLISTASISSVEKNKVPPQYRLMTEDTVDGKHLIDNRGHISDGYEKFQEMKRKILG